MKRTKGDDVKRAAQESSNSTWTSLLLQLWSVLRLLSMLHLKARFESEFEGILLRVILL